jgi:hypothetical protein
MMFWAGKGLTEVGTGWGTYTTFSPSSLDLNPLEIKFKP